MTLEQLKQIIDAAFDRANSYSGVNAEDIQVGIKVFRVGAIGGTPVANINSIHMGFDWDMGKMIITPEPELRETDRDEIKTLIKKYDELSWKHSQINSLKRENENLKKEIENLKLNDNLKKEIQKPKSND